MLLPAASFAQLWRASLYLYEDSLKISEVNKEMLPVDLDQLYQISSTNGNPSKIELLQVGGSYYAWENCNLNVYRWTNEAWVNTYKYNNYGYFCDGYPLGWKNTLYLLGGNGLVNFHSDLLIFDESLGSWEFVSTKSQPLDYNTPFVGLVENGAFSLFGKKVNLRTGLQEPVEHGYFLDLNELSWYELDFEFIKSENKAYLTGLGSISIDTKDYLLVQAKEGWLVFDKSTYSLHYLADETLPLIKPSFSKVGSNRITWTSSDGMMMTFEVDTLMPKAELLAEGKITPVKKEKVKSLQIQSGLIISFFLGLVVLLLVRLYLKSKRKMLSTAVQVEPVIEDILPVEEKSGSDAFWNKVLQSDGKIFSTAQLDEFFEIQNVSPENRKARRSRIIKAFNDRAISQLGKEIILRERDPMDKRFFRFRIQIN